MKYLNLIAAVLCLAAVQVPLFADEEFFELCKSGSAEEIKTALDSGASGYGETGGAAAGRAAFESRVDAAVAARRLTRTDATRLKADYQAVIQLETRYQADGVLSAARLPDSARRACLM